MALLLCRMHGCNECVNKLKSAAAVFLARGMCSQPHLKGVVSLISDLCRAPAGKIAAFLARGARARRPPNWLSTTVSGGLRARTQARAPRWSLPGLLHCCHP